MAVIILAVRDLLFRSRIESVASRLGVPIALAPRDRPISQAVGTEKTLVLLDLGDPGALEQIPSIREKGAKVVAFAGHVMEDLIQSARDKGADEVLSRGELVAKMADILRMP